MIIFAEIALCLRAPQQRPAADFVLLSFSTDSSRKWTILPEVKKQCRDGSMTSRSMNTMNGGLWVASRGHFNTAATSTRSDKSAHSSVSVVFLHSTVSILLDLSLSPYHGLSPASLALFADPPPRCKNCSSAFHVGIF